MTLPASGAISFNNVNTELGLTSTAQISMNDSAVRTLFGVASGQISMSNGYGKSNILYHTITASAANLNLRSTLMSALGWDGTTAKTFQVTINSGVTLSSTSINSAALILSSFPSGSLVYLINNGNIRGKGGNGASANAVTESGTPGQAGGAAISTTCLMNITNNGTIYGGGGGGAGWWATSLTVGLGGGGGAGINSGSGGAGSYDNGENGTSSAGGAGGYFSSVSKGGPGGAPGSAGGEITEGVSGEVRYAMGAAGAYAVGNSNITWTTIGDRKGVAA